MKTPLSLILASLLVFSLSGVFIAEAATLVSQVDDSDLVSTGDPAQNLGTGLTGTPTQIILTLASSGSSRTYAPQILCYTSATYLTACPGAGTTAYTDTPDVQTITGTTKQRYSFILTNVNAFDPSKYYQVIVNASGNHNTYGTLSGSGCIVSCTGAMYFEIADVGGAGAPNTSVLSLVSPAKFGTTASTTVTFTMNIYYNDTGPHYDTATLALTNTTDGYTVNTPTTAITTSGGSTINFTMSLVSGDFYTWQGVLTDSTGVNPPIYSSDVNPFSVVTPAGSDIINFDPNNATSTIGSVFSNFLNLPGLVAQKFPFSYIPQVFQLISSNATLTGTSTFPTLAFDLGLGVHNSIFASSTVTFFATSTITQYISSGTLSTIRLLVGAVLWFGAIMVIYWEAITFFK